MLLLLEGHELTVSELCSVLQLPQSTVSRHLKTLADTGWVASRRDGTSRYYTLAVDDRTASTQQLWAVLRDQVASSVGADQDGRRLTGVLARRRVKSEEFFSSSAGQWDRLRQEMFGRASSLHALPALLDPSWVVGDLGCGTGQTTAAVAPFVSRVIAVDRSSEMLAAASHRLDQAAAVEIRRGELEALPIADAELDVAIMMLVLHYVPDPTAVLREAARALRPGGRLLLCDMLPHDREEYKHQMGHVWLGFSSDQIQRLLGATGFAAPRFVPMPADPDARGPALFVASSRRRVEDGEPRILDLEGARTSNLNAESSTDKE
jgi:ArsR family transcriptional regulator